MYVLRPGHVFEPDRATVGYLPDNTAMTYFVDENEEVRFLEQPGGPSTWSEIVARRGAT